MTVGISGHNFCFKMTLVAGSVNSLSPKGLINIDFIKIEATVRCNAER